jgi:hypothetical protein
MVEVWPRYADRMPDSVTVLDGRKRLHAVDDAHPSTRSPGVFARVGVSRIEAIVKAIDPDDDFGRVRWRLWWFRAATVVRAVGWLAGFACSVAIAALALVTPIGLTAAGSAGTPWLGWFITLLLIFVYSFSAWLALYWGLGAIAPSTKLARRVREFEGLSAPGRRGLSRKSSIITLEAAGRIAKMYYRVVTGRTFTRTRPDLAEEVGSVSLSLMIAIPQGGSDQLRRRPEGVKEYREFLKDVLGLLVAQRLDIVPYLQQNLSHGLLVAPGAHEDMRPFLQPFGRRTTAEAVKDYAIPAAAFLVSVIALLVSLVKP